MKAISSFRMSEYIHGFTSWKAWIFSKVAARTSNLTSILQKSRCQNLKSHNESSEKPLPELQISHRFFKFAARTSNLTWNLQKSHCQNLKPHIESSPKPLPKPQISQRILRQSRCQNLKSHNESSEKPLPEPHTSHRFFIKVAARTSNLTNLYIFWTKPFSNLHIYIDILSQALNYLIQF